MSDDASDAPEDALLYFLGTDPDGVVVSHARSNVAQPGLTAVPADLYRSALPRMGACKLADGALQDFAPPPAPAPPREQAGAIFLRAVVDLGWWDYFEQGAAHQAAPASSGGAGKPYDGRAWSTIGKTDRVMVLDAPLNRVARAAEAARVAASGQPAPAAPVISLGAAMDHGDAMVAAAAAPASGS